MGDRETSTLIPTHLYLEWVSSPTQFGNSASGNAGNVTINSKTVEVEQRWYN